MMGIHEKIGLSDEWYTPKYIFDALNTQFDLDVAHPKNIKTNVPANNLIYEDSLNEDWNGFIWCNPPFGGRNGILPWAEKFINHGNGIMLTPDSCSSKWWHELSDNTDAVLFIKNRVKFIRQDGSIGSSPANGTCLFAIGEKGVTALIEAHKNKLGKIYQNTTTP